MPAPQENSEFEIVSACNLGVELTAKHSQCVSLSQRAQALFGEVRLSRDSTWLLTMSTAAGVSGLTWPLAATSRAGILAISRACALLGPAVDTPLVGKYC